MLEICNQSVWQANLYPGWGRNGQYQYTCVVKATFHFDLQGRVTKCLRADPLVEADQYNGQGIKSLMVQASEIMPFKKGCEWILTGTAYPRIANAKRTQVSVSIESEKIGFSRKSLLVFGERHWQSKWFGNSISLAKPLLPLPLSYEFAYGGTILNHPQLFYPSNPVGKGYNNSEWQVDGLLLPQIEYDNHQISHLKQQPEPAGYGPIPLFWQPRLNFLHHCQQSEGQICPHGIDPPEHIYNVAPLDQQFLLPFCGGEKIQLTGFFKDHPHAVSLILPTFNSLVTLAGSESKRVAADTLHIDTDNQFLHLIARVGIACELSSEPSGLVIVE